MRKEYIGISLAVLVLVGVSAFQFIDFSNTNDSSEEEMNQSWKSQVEGEEPEIATLAGGCFWCIEGAYMGVEGIESAVSGYAGGNESTATYDQVTTGETDHREAVRLRYYPSVINYSEVLDIYWRSIDPTDPGGQFSDRGPHYTTAIYVHDEEQRRIAKRTKKEIAESGRFDEPIVTEIENYTTFFRAEDYHQNYSRKNSYRYKAYERASGRKGFVERVWDESPLG
jgi:peptide methionine sulfoxide reductase msrA/msrB